jgi:hypothetical protein
MAFLQQIKGQDSRWQSPYIASLLIPSKVWIVFVCLSKGFVLYQTAESVLASQHVEFFLVY